jgi:molybdopterin-synthase adenylyltransferase
MGSLTKEQLLRYDRHLQLVDIGEIGQEKLLNARILVIGVGGLGSPISLYLAAAGVGTLGLVDDDIVDISNLQRQICHSTIDINRPKVLSAKEKLQAINPDISIQTYQERLEPSSIRSLINEYDFIVDGTDNFPTKFLINDACVLESKPFSHGGVLRYAGQVMTVIPKESACYRCIFRKPPPANAAQKCSQAGILGAIPGMLGSIQAAEVLKWITGAGDLLLNRLLTFDALSMTFREIELNPQPECGVCGTSPTITDLS